MSIIAPQLRTVLRTADDFNVTIPEREALDASLADVARVNDWTVTGPTIYEAILDALKAGRAPEDDPAVAAALTRHQLRLMPTGPLIDAAQERMRQVVVKHAESIHAALATPYAEATQKLTAAHDTLTAHGIRDLDSPAITKGTVPIATAGAQAREAIDALRRIDQAADTIDQAVGSPRYGNPIDRVLRHVDVGDATRDEVRFSGNPSPWEALNRGWTPSLATRAQTIERHIRAEDAQAAAEAEERRLRDRASAGMHNNYFGN